MEYDIIGEVPCQYPIFRCGATIFKHFQTILNCYQCVVFGFSDRHNAKRAMVEEACICSMIAAIPENGYGGDAFYSYTDRHVRADEMLLLLAVSVFGRIWFSHYPRW